MVGSFWTLRIGKKHANLWNDEKTDIKYNEFIKKRKRGLYYGE